MDIDHDPDNYEQQLENAKTLIKNTDGLELPARSQDAETFGNLAITFPSGFIDHYGALGELYMHGYTPTQIVAKDFDNGRGENKLFIRPVKPAEPKQEEERNILDLMQEYVDQHRSNEPVQKILVNSRNGDAKELIHDAAKNRFDNNIGSEFTAIADHLEMPLTLTHSMYDDQAPGFAPITFLHQTLSDTEDTYWNTQSFTAETLRNHLDQE